MKGGIYASTQFILFNQIQLMTDIELSAIMQTNS